MTAALAARPPARPADPPDAELLDRFAAGDHGAFAALVRRHGPMVFGVCRRVLRDPHDAEEAFQVTFLVLVRKGGRLAQPDRLANWLYGVAYRVARKSKGSAARRGAHERAAAAGLVRPDPVTVGPDRAELRAILDEEMVALPEKYRAPLVLCYLEGLTNEDAARRLGWAPGSMSYRLARGRELLRRRLARRGVMCLALWPVFLQVLTERAHGGEVPDRLVDATVARAANEPKPAAGGGRRAMAVPALAVALLLTGLGAIAYAAGAADPPPPAPSPPPTELPVMAPAGCCKGHGPP
jgi:RNA polymerase sigma factor (sigma-70 family)